MRKRIVLGLGIKQNRADHAAHFDWFKIGQSTASSLLLGKYRFTRPALLFIFSLSAMVALWVSAFLAAPGTLVFATLIVAFSLIILLYRHGPEISGPALLFAMTMFVFVWARPLIAFSSQKFNLHYIAALSGISVTDAGLHIYYSSVIASMMAFAITVLVVQAPSGSSRHEGGSRPFTCEYLQAWSLIFWAGALSSLVQTMLYIRYFINGGSYYRLYVLGENAIGVPGLSFAASLMFYGYIGLLLASRNAEDAERKPARKIWTVTFVILTLLDVTHGARGGAFTELLCGVWLSAYTGGARIRVRTWVAGGAGLFLLSQAVKVLRGGTFSLFGSRTILKLFEWFVYTQGLSGELVAPASAQFGVRMENLQFIFAPLLAPIRRVIDPSFGQQTAQSGQSSGLLAQELAYRLAPSYYLAGHGAGSSYIAEAYCVLGVVGVFLATALLTWIVYRGPYLASRSKPALFVFSASLPFILFTPRESFVFCVVPALKASAILFACMKLRTMLWLLR